MKLTEIAAVLGVTSSTDDSIDLNNISTDTRTLQPGDLYIALQGEHFDGHDYLDQASAKGAIAAIISKPVTTELPTMRVENTRKAFGAIAAWHRKQYAYPIIAITGSSGKTTVKEMVASIFAQSGRVLATEKNYNNDIGVPQTLLHLNSEFDFAVIEVGTNHPGEIAYSSQLIKPNIALVNNVAPAHIEGLGDLEGVAKEKGSIYQSLANDGTAIINLDEPHAQMWMENLPTSNIITYSQTNPAMVNIAKQSQSTPLNINFTLATPKGEIDIQLALLGGHHLANALAAASIAMACDVSLEAIKLGLQSVAAVEGRMQLLPGLDNAKIIDDTYNANPGSVKAALDCLADFPGRRIFVFGDMGELGEQAKHYHQEIGHYAKSKGIDSLLCCGENTPATVHAFGDGAHHYESNSAVISALTPLLASDVTCCVKGSRSAKMEQIVAQIILDK